MSDIADAQTYLKQALGKLTIVDVMDGTQDSKICKVQAVWAISGELHPVLEYPNGEVHAPNFSDLRDVDYYRMFASLEQAQAWIKAQQDEEEE